MLNFLVILGVVFAFAVGLIVVVAGLALLVQYLGATIGLIAISVTMILVVTTLVWLQYEDIN